MSKIEWIKHRRPTELDGDASGDVLTRDGLVYYTEVISGVEWIRVSGMCKKDAEIERLRSLLKDCQPYFETILDFSELGSWREARKLFMKIQKEVNDE